MREGRGAQRSAMAMTPRDKPRSPAAPAGDLDAPGSFGAFSARIEPAAARAAAAPGPTEDTPARPAAHALRRVLASRAGLGQAIILAEIIGRPRGLRSWRS